VCGGGLAVHGDSPASGVHPRPPLRPALPGAATGQGGSEAGGEGGPDGFAKQGKRHVRIPLGSAAEASAVLDLLPGLEGAGETPRKPRRVGAMLRVPSR